MPRRQGHRPRRLGLLFQAGCNIIDSQQFGDVVGADSTGLFFMRVHFEAPPQLAERRALDALFAGVREHFAMEAQLHPLARSPRLLLMVSQHGHCLNDLLFRWQLGTAAGRHRRRSSRTTPTSPTSPPSYGIAVPPPAAAARRAGRRRSARRSSRSSSWSRERQVDLVVLARYMQILSPTFCGFLKGRAINIHHSFLPSFKGAKPYSRRTTAASS